MNALIILNPLSIKPLIVYVNQREQGQGLLENKADTWPLDWPPWPPLPACLKGPEKKLLIPDCPPLEAEVCEVARAEAAAAALSLAA